MHQILSRLGIDPCNQCDEERTVSVHEVSRPLTEPHRRLYKLSNCPFLCDHGASLYSITSGSLPHTACTQHDSNTFTHLNTQNSIWIFVVIQFLGHNLAITRLRQ